MILIGNFSILGTTHPFCYQLVLWYQLVTKLRGYHHILTTKTFWGDHPPFFLPVSTVVLTGKTNFWEPPTYFVFLLPVSTMVLSGESLFGDQPPYLLPVSTMVITGKNFLGDHPPFLLPVSTVVLTGNKIKRVPPRTNW